MERDWSVPTLSFQHAFIHSAARLLYPMNTFSRALVTITPLIDGTVCTHSECLKICAHTVRYTHRSTIAHCAAHTHTHTHTHTIQQHTARCALHSTHTIHRSHNNTRNSTHTVQTAQYTHTVQQHTAQYALHKKHTVHKMCNNTTLHSTHCCSTLLFRKHWQF